MKHTIVCLCLALVLFSGAAQAQAVDDRITARWAPDGFWYPGKIDFIDRRGIHIRFDDGDDAVVARNEVRRLSWRVGMRLECNWKKQWGILSGAN